MLLWASHHLAGAVTSTLASEPHPCQFVAARLDDPSAPLTSVGFTETGKSVAWAEKSSHALHSCKETATMTRENRSEGRDHDLDFWIPVGGMMQRGSAGFDQPALRSAIMKLNRLSLVAQKA
jgi:hypothetical protein